MNRRNIQYIGKYNDRRNFPLVDDKLKTKVIAQKAGIAVPKMIGTIEYQYEIKHIGKKLEGIKGFVIKPAQGSAGKGILVIVDRDGDEFITFGSILL